MRWRLLRPSVTGLGLSIPFSTFDILSPGRASVRVGAKAATRWGRKGTGRPIYGAHGRTTGRDAGLTGSIVPASGPRFGKAGVMTRPKARNSPSLA